MDKMKKRSLTDPVPVKVSCLRRLTGESSGKGNRERMCLNDYQEAICTLSPGIIDFAVAFSDFLIIIIYGEQERGYKS